MIHRCMCCGKKTKPDTPDGPGTSHGLCIPCLRLHYPEMAAEVEAELDGNEFPESSEIGAQTA